MKTTAEPFRKRLAKIVEVGASTDLVSRGYDFGITFVILLNLIATILGTYSDFYAAHGAALDAIEAATAFLFAVDYALRLIAARYIYDAPTETKGVLKYAVSFTGLIDLLSFLPYYLPFFFPDGMVAFRIFRIVRIFRLFRINAYYDSLNAIGDVLKKKRQQLVSSVFIILVLMLASSLCMYSVANAAQPEVFANAFSGIWWSVSTLLTVGYGDIYPITTLGKLLGIVITFLGVGMVAIPTGIISAGFVEQYSQMQNSSRLAREADVRFIKFALQPKDGWVGRTVAELALPRGIVLAAVHRGREVLVPNGELALAARDTVVLAADPMSGETPITLREIELLREHPWNGRFVRDLDISRQSAVVLIKRGGRVMIPGGDTRLREGDRVLLHTKQRLPDSTAIEI